MSRAAIPVNPICVERIRAERKALNVTQAELAKRLGISEQSLRKDYRAHGQCLWMQRKVSVRGKQFSD